MARWGRSSVHYRGRKVDIRDSRDIAKLEDLLKQDFADIMKEHYEELCEVSDEILDRAQLLAPFETGALEHSILVRPYMPTGFGIRPGMIAHASAHDRGFDYAVPQEYNETYDHDYTANEDSEKFEGSAHFLGGSFAMGLSSWYRSVTGKELVLPAELEHAKDYVSHLIDI